MSIEAFCPNGHRILCPDDSVGRAARCPKCSTPFRIGASQPAAVAAAPAPTTPASEGEEEAGAYPAISTTPPAQVEHGLNGTANAEHTPSEPSASPAANSSDSKLNSGASESKLSTGGSKITNGSKITGSKIGSGSSKQLANAEPKPGTIAFLCPNGHRLNGPEKLAGRLGQCPHCNTKFQIPPLEVIRAAQSGMDNLANLEEVQFSDTDPAKDPEIAEVEDSAALRVDPSELERMLASLQVETAAAAPARPASGINILGSAINKVASKLTGGVGSAIGSTTYHVAPHYAGTSPQQQHHAEIGVHPLADLMLRLWAEREHGGIIELHLEGGNVLLPDWFEQKLSVKSHGLFAAQAADGTVTMTVVPWDSVERVVIRGVVGLPDGMFE